MIYTLWFSMVKQRPVHRCKCCSSAPFRAVWLQLSRFFLFLVASQSDAAPRSMRGLSFVLSRHWYHYLCD